ncbi:MAG: hypothetical protein H7X80_05705 [bacterium]|nr:hypothetical protein [Candidatus Kapabacteria bacterium]
MKSNAAFGAAVAILSLSIAGSVGCSSTVEPIAAPDRSDSIRASAFFPLHVGDEWRYGTDPTASIVVSVVGTTELLGHTMYRTSFRTGERCDSIPDRFYWRDSSGVVYASPSDTSLGTAYLNPLAQVGDRVGAGDRVVQQRGASLTIPMGSFNDCIIVGFNDRFMSTETFAPGIGLISYRGTYTRYTLTSARIDSKQYP